MRGGVLPRGQGIFAQALGSVLFPGCPGGCSPGQAVGRSVSPQTAEGRGGLWSPGSSACVAGPWQHRWLSQGCPSQGARLRALTWFLLCVCTFLAAPGVCSLLHAGSRAALCPSRAVAGGRGAVGPCRYPVLSSPAAHPSTAGPRGAAGTHTRCLPQPRQFSEVARALCCHGVFRAGRHWRVFAVTCSQRRAAREGGVFRWCWIYELKSSHLASSVSGCRKANVTMEVGRVKTRNPS